MVVYDKYDIVFQEIPNEVSLAFTIKGCQNRCVGCHSQHLTETDGKELTDEVMWDLIRRYKGEITNVLFLGEGSDKQSLLKAMNFFLVHGLKISLYSGRDIVDPDYLEYVTYYKVGRYKEDLGGLNSKTTNQRLFKFDFVEDITHKFQK